MTLPHWPSDTQKFADQLGLNFLQVHSTLASTNDHAASLVLTKEPEATFFCEKFQSEMLPGAALPGAGAVVAVCQTAGKGQLQNKWHADGGSLTATFMFDARLHIAPNEVPLRAGLAVREVVAKYLPHQVVQIKWPNDILVDGKKIAGILCQRIKGIDLLGIGLNVTTDLTKVPKEVQLRATSMHQYQADLPYMSQIFAELYHALMQALVSNDWHEKFKHYDALLGQQVAVHDDQQLVVGQCQGVDNQGRLVIVKQGVRHTLLTGRQVRLV